MRRRGKPNVPLVIPKTEEGGGEVEEVEGAAEAEVGAEGEAEGEAERGENMSPIGGVCVELLASAPRPCVFSVAPLKEQLSHLLAVVPSPMHRSTV